MIVNDRCTICRNWHFSNYAHVCPPLWEVCDPECQTELEYEWDTIFARDPAQAAELFCEHWDRKNSDNAYVEAEQSEILVRDRNTGVVHRLTVDAYMEPTYNASPSLRVERDDD